MSDVLTKTQRSFNMSMIRAENTAPEIKFRNLLLSGGIRDFVMHPKGIIGKPDFYFPNHKKALFIDGCFWHRCKACFHLPKTNKKFWGSKIQSNVVRDRAVNKKLVNLGIAVIRVKEHELEKNPVAVLNKIGKKLLRNGSPKTLDLFAGAGGFSEGFINAGFDVVAHVEMDKDACDTTRTRMIYHALKRLGNLDEYEKYLLGVVNRSYLVQKYNLQKELDSVIQAKIDQDTYPGLIKEVKKRLHGEQLDVIIGGPPCQAYSNIGRSSDRGHMKGDERKHLYKYYVEFLKALKPKVFVFENVPGLVTAGSGIYLQRMRRLMEEAGYETNYNVINAADFGVPQERKRVVLIGWNHKSQVKSYPNFNRVERKYCVKDFLSDLPVLRAGEGVNYRKYKSSSTLLRKLGIVNPKIKVLLGHISRPQSKHDLEIYKIAVRRKNRGSNIKYYELPQRLRTHKNQTGFLDRFKVVDASSGASHTVIAHISKDGNYYIHPDIKQNRSLTVREVARLQTFPDDFKFEGSRTSQFRQIGNAVPPMLSEIIANKLVRYLK